MNLQDEKLGILDVSNTECHPHDDDNIKGPCLMMNHKSEFLSQSAAVLGFNESVSLQTFF